MGIYQITDRKSSVLEHMHIYLSELEWSQLQGNLSKKGEGAFPTGWSLAVDGGDNSFFESLRGKNVPNHTIFIPNRELEFYFHVLFVWIYLETTKNTQIRVPL